MASERFTGVVDQSTTLRYQFNKFDKVSGSLLPFDAYEITKIEIYPTQEDAAANTNIIETILTVGVNRIDVGCYEYTVSPISISSQYFDKIYLIPTEGENTFIDTETFTVLPSGICTSSETRKGYSFNNPDFTSNNGWGCIVTPDELRYVYAFGNELVAPNYQTITDETLKEYVNQGIASLEKDLDIKLIKRIYKYRTPIGQTERDLSAFGDAGLDYEWSEGYDFNAKNVNEDYMYLKLRRRPVISIENVKWKDPTGADVIDIAQWLKPNYEKGSLEFFPSAGSLASLPASYAVGNNIFSRILRGRNTYPDAFFVDYTVGFEDVRYLRKKWPELFKVVGMLAAINLLNDYGDGRSPGLASSSISLAGISESYSTTQSATNALFGARILSFEKQLKDFYKKNKNKYSGLLFGSL